MDMIHIRRCPGFDRTYEELKPREPSMISTYPSCFDRTYEELKRLRHLLSQSDELPF